MLNPRGKSYFRAAELRKTLDAAGANPVDSACFEEYRNFYSLNFDGLLASHHAYSETVEGERIAVQWFVPANPRAIIFFSHGYYDHVGLFGHLFEYALARDIAIFAFDQIGHGLSTGTPATIRSFDRYVRVIHALEQSSLPKLKTALGGDVDLPVHFVGQSMGGALTMEFFHQYPHTDHGEIVLFAPLVRPYAWPLNRAVYQLAKLFIEQRARTITRNAANEEFLHLQHNDPLQADILPVVWVTAMVAWFKRFESYGQASLIPKIVQGKADRTVSWRHNKHMLGRRYPAAKWLWIDDAGHHVLNEAEPIRETLWRWLDDEARW